MAFRTKQQVAARQQLVDDAAEHDRGLMASLMDSLDRLEDAETAMRSALHGVQQTGRLDGQPAAGPA